MVFIEYISNISMILFIFIVFIYGLKEKKNLFELFIDGVVQGLKLVYELFPTLLALIVAVGMIKSSGILDLISKIIAPIFNIFGIDKNLISLIIVRPISGSTTTAMATNIMKEFGVDSNLGIISSCIMGATETTIYVATLYSSKVKIKNIKEVIYIGLIVDFIGIMCSIFAYNIGLMRV